MPAKIDCAGLVYADAPGACGDHALIAFSMASITVAFVCVPPTRKKISATGALQASRIFAFAASQ